MASVFIWEALNHPVIAPIMAKITGVTEFSISLNDVCCYVPVGFGALATFLIFCFTWVTSGSANGALVAAMLMAIIPGEFSFWLSVSVCLCLCVCVSV